MSAPEGQKMTLETIQLALERFYASERLINILPAPQIPNVHDHGSVEHMRIGYLTQGNVLQEH
jgi:N-acetyl-gamma-glutamylphosphate reductase